MKKQLVTALAMFTIILGFAQTATNFTCNDCAGTSHTLFTELDAGKVIVICWVMPCATCIPPASTDASVVQGYATSNPGMVKFYLVDDYANTSCSTLNSWAATNSITKDASFSNAAIKMSDYGTAGMPKTVVLGGGACHGIFYNQNGTVSSTALQAAINSALAPCTEVNEGNNIGMRISVFPNPTVNNTIMSYALIAPTVVGIDIINVLGEKISTISLGIQPAGKYEYQLNFESFREGIYLIKLNTEEITEIIKVIVTR